jgi:hypothetical protein
MIARDLQRTQFGYSARFVMHAIYNPTVVCTRTIHMLQQTRSICSACNIERSHNLATYILRRHFLNPCRSSSTTLCCLPYVGFVILRFPNCCALLLAACAMVKHPAHAAMVAVVKGLGVRLARVKLARVHLQLTIKSTTARRQAALIVNMDTVPSAVEANNVLIEAGLKPQ